MFDLTTVWLLMVIMAVISLFWQVRQFAELASKVAQNYCKRHHLQLLSVAQQSWRLSWKKGPKLFVIYDLNYSADGLTAKKGEIVLCNGKVEQVHHWS
ncbi:MAG: DUF3301 domain-containing protein [Gammaproteobacteria bacterium]|nr:DUF3301 domain-containing protein [Gammaproteobacteria bacterium]